jgi:hypothetical protein
MLSINPINGFAVITAIPYGRFSLICVSAFLFNNGALTNPKERNC